MLPSPSAKGMEEIRGTESEAVRLWKRLKASSFPMKSSMEASLPYISRMADAYSQGPMSSLAPAKKEVVA